MKTMTINKVKAVRKPTAKKNIFKLKEPSALKLFTSDNRFKNNEHRH